MKAVRIIIPFLIFLLIAFGCEDQYMTQQSAVATNAAGQTLKITASPDNLDITAGGAITVLCELYAADGSGIEGGKIIITSTIGTLGDNTLKTDADGVGVTTLSPTDRPGWAVVVATYESMQVMVSVSFFKGDSSAGGTGGNSTPPPIGDDTSGGA